VCWARAQPTIARHQGVEKDDVNETDGDAAESRGGVNTAPPAAVEGQPQHWLAEGERELIGPAVYADRRGEGRRTCNIASNYHNTAYQLTACP
jgi:hypothetical protein